MRRLSKIALISFCTLLSVVSCTQEKSTVINEISTNRIKVKEIRVITGARFIIIEVDGKEYLAQGRGGIIAITK